jgi:hypothetical protein
MFGVCRFHPVGKNLWELELVYGTGRDKDALEAFEGINLVG